MATETLASIDRIQKTFEDLEAEKTLINACTLQWKNLSDHFASLSKTLDNRYQALDSEILSLQALTEETSDSLDVREGEIPDREAAVVASIETKKEAAIKEMEDPEPKPLASIGEILRLYCSRMDAGNLWRFLAAHRKDLSALRKEISDAIAESVDACRLVIDAIDDYMKEGESQVNGGDRAWVMGMLLRALFDSEGRKGPEVSDRIRERAAEVAVEWRKKIAGKGEREGGGEGGEKGGAEAQIFIQIVAAFGLSSSFDGEELKKLVVEHASRKEMAKLVALLRFGEKMTSILCCVIVACLSILKLNAFYVLVIWYRECQKYIEYSMKMLVCS